MENTEYVGFVLFTQAQDEGFLTFVQDSHAANINHICSFRYDKHFRPKHQKSQIYLPASTSG